MVLVRLLVIGLTLIVLCDTARAQDPPPSSYDLIQQARDAGKLTEAQAVKLGLQALAQPGKLPKAYRGGDVNASQVMADVNLALPGLSRSQRRQVAPFLLPPYARQSAWLPKRLRKKAGRARATTAASDCTTYDTVRHDVWTAVAAGPRGVVFYSSKSDRAAARRTATQLKTKILPTLTKLFKAPLPTASTGCAAFGGARKLQVYIVDQATLESVAQQKAIAVTSIIDTPEEPCAPNATFVLMPQNGTKEDLAHEVMHSVQFAYQRCDFLPAFVEGTAMLAQDLVYPGDPNKQRYYQTIDNPLASLLDETGSHAYSTWAFWYALGRPAGAAPAARSKIIRSILQALGTTGATVVGAVQQLVPGGWRGAFKRFAVQRFNAAPVGSPGSPEPESFKQWDAWNESPAEVFTTDITLGGHTTSVAEYKTGLRRPLSTDYQELTISDARVRTLRVEGEVGPDDLVQGFLELADGSWRVEDWTDAGGSSLLCRDKPEENVQRIIVAVSNVEPSGQPEGAATYAIRAADRCALPRVYRGSFTKRDEDGFVVNGTVTFTRSDTMNLPGQAEYELTAGTATWSLDRTEELGGCNWSGSGSQDLSDYNSRQLRVEDVTRPELSDHRDPAAEPLPWYVWADLQPFQTNIDVTYTCPGEEPELVTDFAEPITLRIGWSIPLDDEPPRPHHKQADPLVLEGTYVDRYGTKNVDTYTFRLVGADA